MTNMKAKVYWIPTPTSGRLGTMPKPRGGDWLETEIQSLKQQGVDVVVSLLTQAEILETGLTDEQNYCKAFDISFLSFPIRDHQVPESKLDTRKFVGRLAEILHEGSSIAIHCYAGIGRSSLIAASVLTRYGISASDAFSTISDCRGIAVPDTQEQIDWVCDFGNLDRIMGDD